MTHAQTALILTALQQALLMLAWVGAAWQLRVSRVPAQHWAAASGLMAVVLGLYACYGVLPIFVVQGLANAVVPTAFVLLRRGVQRFVRVVPNDREHAAVALGGAALALIGGFAAGHSPLAIFASSIFPAWCLARIAGESRAPLADEFNPRTADVFSVLIAIPAVLLFARGVAAVLWPAQAAQPGAVDTAFNGLLVASFMILGLTLQLALALLVMLRLTQRLRHLSRHDSLTGLPNRRVLHDALGAAQVRRARRGAPFALLALDLDHFKTVNDGHGHAAGDAALIEVARALRESVRSDDTVARMGGEEFCVLLADCDAPEAAVHAERLRRAVADRAITLPDGSTARLTVSIGGAAGRAKGDAPELLQRADRALYAAKDGGRDRVVFDTDATP